MEMGELAEAKIDCKFCHAEKSAELHAYMAGSAIYYCTSCNYTFNINSNDGEIGDMGKRKNKKNKGKKGKKMNVVNTNNKQVKTVNPADDSWEVKIDCVKECSKASKELIVWFSPLAKAKIDFLMNKFERIEWLAYLLGDFEKLMVDDIFIPNQEISTARVDNVKCEEYNNIPVIGVIHSHHGMGTGFSGTDNDWINQNHNISLCIAHNGISGHVRSKVACGAYIMVDAKVRIKYETGLNEDEFEKEVDERVKEKSYTVYNNNYGNYANGYGYGWQGYQTNKKTTVSETIKEETQNFLTDEEMEEIEKQIDELDFEKELSLAEELEMLNEVDQRDDVEAN